MKTESIYKYLKENTQDFKEGLGIMQLLELKLMLEKDIKLENIKPSTSKTRVNACLKYSEKLKKERRPALAYTCNDQLQDAEGNFLQAFTDAYFLVALSDDDKLPIDDIKTTTFEYPNLKRIFNYDQLNSNKKLSFVVNDALNMFKMDECILFKNKDYKVILCKPVFKHFIDFMNVKANEKIELLLDKDFNNSGVRPIYLKHNNSYGLILPARRYDDAECCDLKILECE